jgi:hypothetical protein
VEAYYMLLDGKQAEGSLTGQEGFVSPRWHSLTRGLMNRAYHFSCFTPNLQDPRKRVIYVCSFSMLTFLNCAALRRMICILLTLLSCWSRMGYIPSPLPMALNGHIPCNWSVWSKPIFSPW